MESKKNIGNLFRENLEQLDYTPSTKVWEQIELDLEKKKRKRRIFFWFFFAIILTGIVLSGGYMLVNDNSSSKEVKETISLTEKSKENLNATEVQQNHSSTGKLIDNSTIGNENKNTQNNSSKNSISVRNSKTTSEDHKNDLNSMNQKSSFNPKIGQRKNALNKKQTDSKIGTVASRKNQSSKKQSQIVSTSSSKDRSKPNQSNFIATVISSNEVTSNQANKASLEKNSTIEKATKQTPIDSLLATANEVEKVNRKKTKPKDSIPLEKTETTTKEKEKEYEIVVAPYYGLNHGGYFGDFNALSNNRVLDEKIETSATYGVLLRWMFGDKLGIQTGIGKINNSYTATVEKTGAQFINTQTVATDQPISNLNTIFSNETKVKFTYESSFLEVPFEAYYVVRNKKLGLATSFGISMLFGNKNTVYAASETIQSMKIGTLSSISPTSATLNAKMNLFYKISPSLQVDLYPTFQYQIMGNTNSSDYSSYFLSIRTGLSYKF